MLRLQEWGDGWDWDHVHHASSSSLSRSSSGLSPRLRITRKNSSRSIIPATGIAMPANMVRHGPRSAIVMATAHLVGARRPTDACGDKKRRAMQDGQQLTHTHSHTHTHTPSLSRSASSIISVSSSSESFSPSSCACDKQRTHGDEPMHGCAAKATQAQPNLARGRAEECQAGELEKSLEEILGIASAGANYALLSSDSGM